MSDTEKEITISIVSPSWNQGAYVEECISSIDEEYRDRVEHIIIDNCSDDETHGVLKKHSHLKTVIEPDKGQSEALNKGFQLARGKWILWLNVDDYLMPGALEAYFKTIENSNSYNVVYGHMRFVDELGEKIRVLYHPQWFNFMTRLGLYVLPSTGSLYKSSLLKENPLSEDFHMIMDSEWMLRCGSKVKAKRLDQEMVAFRITEDNKTAIHITTGELTPRHRSERLKLAERYPYYSHKGETDRGRLFYTMMLIIRKLIRAWILCDKGICKLRAGWV